ncbi:single-stranded-DNA-specific exonuclease RecJ [Candidatus Marinamargulisbacteria bacterium SCGC AAA071-K20]|nr:single-stranded-DNA-specific exonuclease RecJ [Candidatus Marinamargulisbacteria bacterium SCGC AAA071-K20]
MPVLVEEVIQKRWRLHKQHQGTAQKISEHLNIHPLLCQILLNRNITSLDKARLFLGEPDLDSVDYFDQAALEASVSVVFEAIEKNQKILIYGDYDVDGITSTTLLVDFLKQINANVHFFIPNRFEHGYGLHVCVGDLILQTQATVLITLDCGVSSKDIIDPVVEKYGTKVIILDHHKIPDELPNFDAMLNPKTLHPSHYLAHLCTAGIVYEFIKFYIQHYKLDLKSEPFLDLVALGTVADIAKLEGANRTYIKRGLPFLSRSHRPGIRALLERAKCEKSVLTTRDCGFVIAPRLNASGRLASALLGVELLLSDTVPEADKRSHQLEALNQDRREIDLMVFKACVAEVEGHPEYKDHPILVLSGKEWHSGVIGITAAKLVDKYSKPVVIVSFAGNIGRASARSVGKVDLYEVLKTCKPYFETFGGHKEAAGFSIKEEKMAAFKEALIKNSIPMITPQDLQPIVNIDAEVDPKELTLDLAEQLMLLEPFGQGNPQPILHTDKLKLIECKAVGTGEHVKTTFSDETGRHIIEGIGFGLSHKMALFNRPGFSVIFHLSINEWKGRRLPQLEIVDIK